MGVTRTMDPVDLTEQLRQCPGEWVAVKEGKVVEVRGTPRILAMALRQRGITAATILRAPRLDEPEFVGLG